MVRHRKIDGEYEITFRTAHESEAQAVSKVCAAVDAGMVRNRNDVVFASHARWVEDKGYQGKTNTKLDCTKCGHYQLMKRETYARMGVNWRFCPNCGSKMDGE